MRQFEAGGYGAVTVHGFIFLLFLQSAVGNWMYPLDIEV